MSVTGVAQRSEALQYQKPGKPSGTIKTQGFGEDLAYEEELAMQAMTPTFASEPLDPVKESAETVSGKEVQAYNAYMVEKGYMNPENVEEQSASDRSSEEESIRIEDLQELETSLTSGLIGFGGFEDGTKFSARYADNSTPENPIVQVRITDESGTEIIANVKINQVNPEDATELEMFAFLAHLDKQGISGNNEFMGSYRELMYRAGNSSYGDERAYNVQSFMFQHRDWRHMTLSMTNFGTTAAQALEQTRQAAKNGAPYSYLAKDGIIEYNGVVFVCDDEKRTLSLGDTSDLNKCIRIPLSGGGSLVVNRDNLGDLAKAIGMFSPEDVNRILRAIAEDAKIQQMKQQIDDETSGIDLVDSTQENDAEGEKTTESMEILEATLPDENKKD